MTRIVEAFGQNLSFPADATDDEILAFVNDNSATLDPDYKEPEKGFLEKANDVRKNFIQDHLGVNMEDSGKKGFFDPIMPKPSIATQAEMQAEESANMAAPEIQGAPVRQSAYKRALLNNSDREPGFGINQRIQDTADQDVRGQEKQQAISNAMTDELPEPEGGFVASAKSVAGQAIKGVGRIGSDFMGADVDNPIAEYGQRIIDANPVAVRELSDIKDEPFLAFRESTGNAVGMMGGMVGTKALGMGITTMAPLTGPAAPVVAAVGQFVQWLGPAAVAALPSYSGIRDSQILKDPDNERDAKSKAIAVLGAGAVGAIEQAFGPQQWALAAMTKEGRAALARKFASTSRIESVIKGSVKGAAIEGAEELVQSPIEQLASYDDPTTAESIDETLFGGAMGALGGIGTGGAVGAITPLQKRSEQAARINSERTRSGLEKINSAKNVDEAIEAANETVSQKPVTSSDIFDDQAARQDLLNRAIIANQPESTEVGAESILAADSGTPNESLQVSTDNASDKEIIAQKTGGQLNGAKTEIVLPDNTSLPAQWEVVDADTIKATLKDGENQPRDRSRVSSDIQIQQIANNPDYRRLSDSPVMDVGAPTLSQDGLIVGGNGRFEALSTAYEKGTIKQYLSTLTHDAINKGIDPQSFARMKKPVLVRRITRPYDTKKAAIASNSGGSLQYSALELARIDADRLHEIDQIEINDSGDIALTARNISALRNSLSQYGSEEVASFVGKDGNLSQEGVKRIKNAILYSAYGDSPTLSRMVKSTDNDMRNIVGALTKVAGDVSKVRSNIKNGAIPKELDVTENLIEAVEKISQLRANGTSIEQYMAQDSMFSDIDESIETREIIQELSELMRSQKKMAEFIRAVYDGISKINITTDNIFGDSLPTKQEVIRSAKQRQQAEIQPGLFDESDNQSGKADQSKSGAKNGNAASISESKQQGEKFSRSPEERLKDRERASRLQRLLGQEGYEFKITPTDMRDAAILGDEAAAETAERIASVFNKRITWIKADGQFGINGVVIPSIKDTIFIDVRTEKMVHAVMGHELSHHMEQDSPQLYAEMVDALKSVITNDEGYRKKYDLPSNETSENIIKEIVGDIVGDNFTDQKFWNKVAAYNPNSFRQIADKIISWLKNLVLKSKARKLGSEQWVTDAQKAQDIVAKAVSKYTYTKSSFDGLKNKAMFQAAWHGSPHDHDKFSNKNIGTGEGAAAYGYGLYFTENKDVAEWYKDNLSRLDYNPEDIKTKTGETVSSLYNSMDTATQAGREKKMMLESLMLRMQPSAVINEAIEDDISTETVDWFKSDVAPYIKNVAGKLYQVELAPKQDEYLLWDKPLSEQSEKVKNALEKYFNEESNIEYYNAIQAYDAGDERALKNAGFNIFDYPGAAGGIYEREAGFDGAKNISKLFHKYGIRGIKYLDGSSRGKGDGSYNYVIFSDEDVAITAKFSFAGKQSKTADPHQLSTAQEQLNNGVDAEKVRQDTGWFKGKDGQWRYEIDDSKASFKKPFKGDTYPGNIATTLGQMLSHKRLFAAYPDLASVQVVPSKKGVRSSSYNDMNRTIALAAFDSEDRRLSVLLHEIQHGIQYIEGFAEGGSPRAMKGTKLFQDKLNKAKEIDSKYSPSWYSVPPVVDEDIIAHDLYMKIDGEIEARNVQARLKLTGKDRKLQSPESTADIPSNEAIVIYNGEVMENAPQPENAKFSRKGKDTLSGELNLDYRDDDSDPGDLVLTTINATGESYVNKINQIQGELDFGEREKIQGDINRAEKQDSPPEVRKEALNSNTANNERIEDFGEKIGGARKDVWQSYQDTIDQSKLESVAQSPLSKSWPEPDYEKLIENGADTWAVAFIRSMRDMIPSKPKNRFKLARWVNQVESLRGLAYSVIDGSISASDVRERLSETISMSSANGSIALYQEFGHSKSLKGIKLDYGDFNVYGGETYNPPKRIWTVSKAAKATSFGNWPTELANGDTREEAINNFRRVYESLGQEEKVSKQVSFDIYKYRDSPEWVVGKKVGSNHIDLAKFGTVEEARAYKTDHYDDLVNLLQKAKEIPGERKESNSPRVGIDHRNGQDVTPEMFNEAFGFRGVEFGNYVEGGKRQQDLNQAYDALMDMAGILGIPSRSISLNGELGLAFGARGKGGLRAPAAHYERGHIVINLTKKEGAGSLGHEWWHALDNYFARSRGKKNDYMTESLDVSLASRKADFINKPGIRREMIQAYGDVMSAIKNTALKARSSKLDAKRTKAYWTTDVEMSARAFESYLIAKLQDQNASNDYLANIVDEKTWEAAGKLGWEATDSYPYPIAGEVPVIRAGFDHFFDTVQSKETDKGVALFSRKERTHRTMGYPKSANEPIFAYETSERIKLHRDYKSAKSGDIEAAVRLVKDLVPKENIAVARDMFGSDVAYLPVVLKESNGTNRIPHALAALYASSNKAELSSSVYEKEKAFHTGMNMMERLVSRASFDGEIVRGKKYVLVDDVTTSGATLSDLSSFVHSNGGEVVGSVLLTNAMRAGSMFPSQKTINRLEAQYGDTIREIFGIEPSSLTKEESQYLIGFRTDDELRNRAATARDSRRERILAKRVPAPKDKLKFSRADTLSQAGVNTEESENVSDLPEETKFQAFRRRSQDAMLRFKVVQNWLDDRGVELSEAANVYQRENVSKGKTANKIEDFRNEQLEPLIKRIAETSKKADKEGKFTLGDIATYLEAIHIPEANARMREIHKKKDATANGITDDQAKKVVDQFKSMPNFAEFRQLAEEMRDIGKDTLDMRLDAGLISQEQYDAYQATYQNWVPLRGNMSEQGFGKGMSTSVKDKRRMGHGFREEEFVIENLVQDRERAIMQIEKNKVGMSVAEFLMEAQNENIGTVGKPEMMRVMKDHSFAVKYKGDTVGSFDTQAAAKAMVDRILSKKESLLDGESFTQTDFKVEKTYDPHIVMMARPQLAENEVQVYVNGHAIKLQLNDAGLARAATNAGIEQVGAIMHGARMFNRFLSKAYTAWSPDFLFMNMARDAYSGTLVLTGKKGAKFTAKTFSNYGTAIKELIKGRRDPKQSEWVTRYRAAGGNIGAAYLSDIERVGEDALAALQEFAGARETYRMVYNEQISKGASAAKARTMATLKAGSAKIKAAPVVGHMFKTLERVNMVIENALRLATFKTAVESGESDQQAAMLSKDLMNFNRKGEIANQAGALYLFFNPGMQGAHIVGEALFTSKHKKQVWSLLGAMTTLSFVLSELGRGDDDDDREWENTPGYIKDRNLIIGAGDSQITIPVAYGFGIFHAMGNYLSDLNHGADKSEIAVKLASGMFENFSVFGNPILDENDEIRPDQLLPTLPKIIMAPGINLDGLGRQIHPTKYQDSVPDSQLMWRSVRGTAYDDIAQFMNGITGGSEYNPGAIDISPNTIKYWVTSLTGGAGRFASDITTGALNAAEGVGPEIENVPVLRKFIREPGVSDSRSGFHAAKREAQIASERFNKALRNGDVFQSQKMLDEHHEIIALANYAKQASKLASEARDAIMNVQTNEGLTKAEKKLRIKEIEIQEQRIYDEFLSIFDKAKEKARR